MDPSMEVPLVAERRVSATEARVHFGELLDSVVKHNDIVFVERAGMPQVVVVSVEEWHRRTGDNDPWAGVIEMMDEHHAHLREEYGDSLNDVDWAEEIRAAREERDEQLLGNLPGR